MAEYLAALSVAALVAMVLSRVLLLRRQGIRAMCFGDGDRSDFIILPFALLYLYTIAARTFDLPTVSRRPLFDGPAISWLGVLLCALGLGLMVWSLVSFGRSFRVGIDRHRPDELVTTGAFAVSRNPIYVAFALVLIGEFLVFADWVLLIYVGAGFWLFHRQVLREEATLSKHYGRQFTDYRRRVRRYL